MSGQIFISYRRDDSSAWAGRLYDGLSRHFVSNQIFMDVDAIEPGVDFVEAIEKSVGSCDVLIAVIGKRWLISSDEEGGRRIDNPEDFVRVEIVTALKRGIRVIPVLVDNASMPRSGDLSGDLKPLVRRQALAVSHERFRADTERLIGAVEQALQSTRLKQQPKREGQEGVDAKRHEQVLEPGRVAQPEEDPPVLVFRNAAAAGHTGGMVRLGDLYRDGKGVVRDYGQARRWYQKAAEAGYPEAMNNLGYLYEKGWGVARDYGQARRWYQKAAEAGDAYGMYNLGVLYQNGWGMVRDYGQARRWYQKAADAGNASAKQALSQLPSK